jgi:predicted phospho-2-dehydro-3-deoxyheptonate aldolase
MSGKLLRLARLIPPDDGRTCIVPLDHGITYGPIAGIGNYIDTINQVFMGGADAVILHKGLLDRVSSAPEIANGHYIMHLSASTILSDSAGDKVLVSTIEEALKLGADGVSVHINLGTPNENVMLKDLGVVGRQCYEWGIPLLAMMYVYKKDPDVQLLSHATRIAEELGADIVKISYPGSKEKIEQITKCTRIPVVVAGGPKTEDIEDLIREIHSFISIGVSGVAIGRNVFQHPSPLLITRIITNIVHRRATLEECLAQLRHPHAATIRRPRKTIAANVFS